MPKRKADVPQVENDSNDEAPADSPPPVKQGRGRPKGSGKPKKIVDPDAPKRSRGRPRINPPKDPDAPKKPRGRPPAEPSTPKKESPVKAKVTSSSPGKRGRPAGSKNKPRKKARKSSSKAKQAKPVKQQDEDDETAEQSDE